MQYPLGAEGPYNEEDALEPLLGVPRDFGGVPQPTILGSRPLYGWETAEEREALQEPRDRATAEACDTLRRTLGSSEHLRVACAIEGEELWAVALLTNYPLSEGAEPVDETGTWWILHRDARSVTRSAKRPYHRWPYNCEEPDVAAPDSVVFADVDGDGTREAGFITHNLVDSNCRMEPSLTFWTARRGKPKPYQAAPPGIFWATDFDCDGRLDLIVHPYGAMDLGYFGLRKRASREWSLLAHALPGGGYSFDDDSAQRYARALCPSAPTPWFTGDRMAWPAAAHCARLHGVTPAELRAALTERCAGIGKDSEEYLVTREFCERDELRPLLEAPLPLRLTP